MKRIFFCFLLLILSPSLKATHNVAGEITLACVNDDLYKVTITTYTYYPGSWAADRCALKIYWGDGDSSILVRANGPSGLPCSSSEGNGVFQVAEGFPNYKKNEYTGYHTYSPGSYQVMVIDPNRVAGIMNIPNSVNVPFVLMTTLIVNPYFGCNSTPVLTSLPLDNACSGHCYFHNVGAYDPDNDDSLSFAIGPAIGPDSLPLPGYTLPNIPGGGNLSIDPVTGDVAWCNPMVPGDYSLVIYVYEWKKMQLGYVNKSIVRRDMMIHVEGGCNNDNPLIDDLPDLCVDAGTLVTFPVFVNDPDNDLTRLDGFGAVFSNSAPAATLTNSGVLNPVPFTGNFNWQTTCENIRIQPWIVTFKATDAGTQPLMDIETVKIKVVSPGPATLTAIPQAANINLSWSQNPCDPVSNICMGYKIYRRQNPSGWNPGPCETGVPAYTGFVLIGNVQGVTNTSFTDSNGGQGLNHGIDYCYRVCAVFLDGAESYASPESCAELLRDVPIITHVDVVSTGSNDTIYVAWENPVPDGINFDTIAHPGPYTLDLERSAGFNFSTGTPVTSFTENYFAHLPTFFFDTGLGTATGPYSYRLAFGYGANPLYSKPASSVFLSATPSDNTVTLNWQYIVPWTNFEFAIYRYNSLTNAWDSLGNSMGAPFADTGLQNGVEYCYYVTSHGSYFNAGLPPVSYNRSQRTCMTPFDLTAPCEPVLTVSSNCQEGLNQLFWTNPMHMNCGTDDVVAYHIWYSPITGQEMQLIATVTTDTTIIYQQLESVAGCYAVTALDTFNNESSFSNIVCIDNCPLYELPNVFTPNGDNTNDFFIPFPYLAVKSVDLKIYDRWGVVVFETMDPAIGWDGTNQQNGKACVDGVYYYTCTVHEIRLEGVVARKIQGFVHVLR